jgi:hypothetical protein
VTVSCARSSGRVAQLGLLVVPPETVEVRLENGCVLYTHSGPEGVDLHGRDDILHIRAALSQDGLTG